MVAVIACVGMVAGCGARLSKEELNAAGSSTGGASGGGGTGAAAVAPGDATAPGAATAAAGGSTATTAAAGAAGGAARGGGGGGATATTAPKTGVAGAPAAGGTATTAAPAGGNGGATDVGVTANSITLANVSTVTGPVPGLFAGAINGTQAYFAYQNSLGGVNGRQLKLQVGDDRFDCGTNRSTTEQYAKQVFGFVGSFSLFDGCGAPVFNANPTIADVHNGLSADAAKEPNNFSAVPVKAGISLGVVNYIKSKYPGGIGAVGSLVADVQSAKESWAGAKKVMQANGFTFAYERNIAPTETDFTADVVQMRSKGVKLVLEIAADAKTTARLQTAAQQQNWKPDAFIGGGSLYDTQYLPLAGAAAEGTLIYNMGAMFQGEDRALVPEVDLFLTWVKKTFPNATVDLFTAYGWASGRLFTQALQAAGPKVTRAAVIEQLKKINSFDANGFLAKTDPAGKGPPSCFIIIKVQGGKFTRLEPASGYRCDGPYAVG